MTLFFLAGIGVYALNCGNIERRRHKVNNCVEKLLNALVSVRSTAGYGYELILDSTLSDSLLDFLGREIRAFVLEVTVHKVVVKLGNRFKQSRSVLLCLIKHIRGDFLNAHILSEVVIINIGVHFNQVDNALKICFSADRKLNRNSVALKSVLHHMNYIVEICAHNVHLIYISHSGYMIVVSLTPNGFRLRLNTALCAENGYGTVKYAKRTLNFNRKVNVSGGVDNIDTVLFPERGSSGGGDGDTSLLLLLHPVHRGSALVGFTKLVVDTRVEQDTLRRGGLSGVDMSHYTNITGHFKSYVSFHLFLRNYAAK